jgi:hypothetical protein
MQENNRLLELKSNGRHGWDAFMQEVPPAPTLLLIGAKARLREVHPHGWTIAVTSDWVKTVGEHRRDLEAALTRLHGGSPKCIHIVELGQ